MFEKDNEEIDYEFKRSRNINLYKIMIRLLKNILLKVIRKIIYSTAGKKKIYITEASEILMIDSDIFHRTIRLKFEDTEFYAPIKSKKFF